MDELKIQILPDPMMLSFRCAAPTPGPEGPVVGSAVPSMVTQAKLFFMVSPFAHRKAGDTGVPEDVPVASLR